MATKHLKIPRPSRQAGRNRSKYGQFSITRNNRTTNLLAHRAAYRIHYGVDPAEKQVKEIRRLFAQGYSGYRLAKLFKLNHKTIYAIRDRKLWRHL